MEKIPRGSIEGRMYGEVAAWITLIGMAAAVMGTAMALGGRDGVLDEHQVLSELLAGKSEQQIWRTASAFHRTPARYWFFETRICADEIAMAGIAVACYGSVVGLIAMIASMFRSRRELFYKGGLFTALALVITMVMFLAASGVVSLRH